MYPIISSPKYTEVSLVLNQSLWLNVGTTLSKPSKEREHGLGLAHVLQLSAGRRGV